MDVTRRHLLGATAATVALAGCLGDDGENGDGPDDGENGDGPDDGENGDEEATVGVREHDEYGEVLVGPEGLSLYNFDSDERGAGESTCYDGCEENWPPLTVSDEPTAGEDVTAELTTFERDDGSTQVAADGWPLYYFAGDDDPGDVEGQGVNDVWWLLEPDGTPIRTVDDEDDGEGDDEDTGPDVGY